MNNTPELTMLTLFGAVLEDADPAERATLLSDFPHRFAAEPFPV